MKISKFEIYLRKIRRTLTPALLMGCVGVLLASLTFGGCAERKKYRIGVSQCSADDWRRKMNEEIEREILLHPEAEVEIRSADDSSAKQIEDLRYFRDNGFDIIVCAPNEADSITPVVREIYESGLPVIIFDRTIHGDTYTAYQGVNNEEIGRAAAEYAATLLPAGGKVLEIRGLDGSSPSIGRREGFRAAASARGLEIVASAPGNWNHDLAAKVADSVFRQRRDIDLVYAHNDRMAIAASEAARRNGLDVKVIGIDAAPEIGMKAVADSVIDATFLYPTEGYRLIRTALAVLEGEPYERNLTLPLTPAVDKSNAEILLLQNESIKEDTDKIKTLKVRLNDYLSRQTEQRILLYAVLAIAVLLFVVLFMTLRAYWQHRRHQEILLEQNKLLEEQRDMEKDLNRQPSEATQSKLRFFTNVSHDLRTPLTLIAEPVEQLASSPNLSERELTLVRIANKNVKILRRLINQILDFRKYENGKLDVNMEESPFKAMLADWLEAFGGVARQRRIKLDVDIDLPDDFTLAIDGEKIERVVFNIVSNAFKYTADGGRVAIRCYLEGEGAACRLFFAVEDTGRGIAAEEIGHIFDRFFQVDKVHPDGSGIGLSLAKAFVELHEGTISVESRPGEGSTFTVELPVKHVEARAQLPDTPDFKVINKSEIEAELGEIIPSADALEQGKPLMLIVDDNEDIRKMISELLGDEYNIIGAADGKEGIRLASKFVPDIIVCDVMMPVMDGLECCSRIKGEVVTSHIPVLMLTACSMDEQRIQGYESGADGYLAKPFNSALLRTRCRNLIENRKHIKELYGNAGTGSPLAPKGSGAVAGKEADAAKDGANGAAKEAGRSGVNGMSKVGGKVIGDIDNEFYDRFLRIVDENMSDPDLNVNAIAEKIGLGRSQFYRKLKALTNFSPVELLRDIRLKRAHTLIATTDKTISEIGYESGFASPAYFTRCYREAFGETPSEARARLGR